jgi:hypothetical protein
MSDQIFEEYKLSNKIIVLFNLSKNQVETNGCARLHWQDCIVKIGFRKNNTFIIDFDNLSFGIELSKSGEIIDKVEWNGYMSTTEKFIIDYKIPTLERNIDYQLYCWSMESGQKLEYRDIINIPDWEDPFPDGSQGHSKFLGIPNTVIYHKDYVPTPQQLRVDQSYLPE